MCIASAPSAPNIPPPPPPVAPIGDGPKVQLAEATRTSLAGDGSVIKRGAGTSSLRIPRAGASLNIPT